MKSLVLATLDSSNFSKITSAVRALVFFGYPHQPSSIPVLRERLLQHMLLVEHGAYSQHHLLRLVDSLSETIDEVNGLFVHTKMLIQAHILNVFSTSQSEQVSNC